MSLVEIKLKPPQLEQLPQVVALDRQCLGGIWTLQGYQKEWESPTSTLFVLSIPGETGAGKLTTTETIIGFGCFWAILEEAHLTILAVRPDYQGKGLGQLLLSALLRDACQRNLERATLEVRASNQVALSLYEKFGFKTAGRRKGYYQATGEDALILWRGDLEQPEFQDNLALWQQQVHDQLFEQGFRLVS